MLFGHAETGYGNFAASANTAPQNERPRYLASRPVSPWLVLMLKEVAQGAAVGGKSPSVGSKQPRQVFYLSAELNAWEDGKRISSRIRDHRIEHDLLSAIADGSGSAWAQSNSRLSAITAMPATSAYTVG